MKCEDEYAKRQPYCRILILIRRTWAFNYGKTNINLLNLKYFNLMQRHLFQWYYWNNSHIHCVTKIRLYHIPILQCTIHLMNSVNYELFNALAPVSVVVSDVSMKLDISRSVGFPSEITTTLARMWRGCIIAVCPTITRMFYN